LDHVKEINDDITNVENSINMNLLALNEEMRYDAKLKEKIDVEKVKKQIGRPVKLKNFIELPNQDHDVVIEKEGFESLKNEPPLEERNILVEEEEAVEGYRNVKVDDSHTDFTDNNDSDVKSDESDAILVEDGEAKDVRDYATNICIPHFDESEVIAGNENKSYCFSRL
jgi:hypothetical protein